MKNTGFTFFRRIGVLIILSLSCTSHAGHEIVFMAEGSQGKQIYLYDEVHSSLQPLTQGALWHLYPDISADGKKIAYAQGADAGHLEIILRDRYEKTEHSLSLFTGMNLHPRFSKDQKCLAYSGPNGHGKQVIHLLNFSTHKNIEIEYGTGAYFPNPSSDCQWVVFQGNLSPTSKIIAQYEVATGLFKSLTAPDQISMSPSLSADDRWVAYTQKVHESFDIFTYDRYTSEIAAQVQSPYDDMAPAFTSEQNLLFASNRTGHFELYQTPLFAKSVKPSEDPFKFDFTSLGDVYSARATGELEFTQKLLPSFTPPARSSFAVARIGSTLYMVGGHQGPEHTYPENSFLNRIDSFDLSTQQWKTLQPRKIAAHGYEVAACGKYLYAFGGFAYSPDHDPHWKSLDIIERFDTETQRWETIGHLPRARSSYVMAQIDSVVYLLGGWDSTPKTKSDYEGTFLSQVDTFDCQNQQTATASFNLPKPLRRAFTGVVTPRKKILLIGGLGIGSSHFELLNNVTEIDPQTGQSKDLTPLPFATFAPAAGFINDQLFVFGGMFKTSPQDYQYVNHIYRFNLESMKWSHTGRYLSEAKGFSRVFNLDPFTLGILGGHVAEKNTDHPTNVFESFALGILHDKKF